MAKSILMCLSKLAVAILCIVGLIELGLALWTLLEDQYKSLAYNLADVGYIVSAPSRSPRDPSLLLPSRISGYYGICPCVFLPRRSLH